MGNCCGTHGLKDLPKNQVMTSYEAAIYLRMHVKTICRLAKEGKIPAKQVDGEWHFLCSILDKWLIEALV